MGVAFRGAQGFPHASLAHRSACANVEPMPLKFRTGAVALLATIAAIVGCRPVPQDNGASDGAANQETAPTPSLPVADPPLDRSGLLLAVARAASATALGRNDISEQQGLDGQRFEMRIRFGCPAAVLPQAVGESSDSSTAPFVTGFNPKDRTLRIRARPDLTRQEPWIATLGGEEVEAVEGFWIYRPWLLLAGCPAPLPDRLPPGGDGAGRAGSTPLADPARPVAQARSSRVGIAHFLTTSDPRTGRRNRRAYEATKVLDAERRPSGQGYNLVLAGRLKKLPTRRVISCQSTSVNAPPDCVVSAQFDRVRIEWPDSSEVIAEWSN